MVITVSDVHQLSLIELARSATGRLPSADVNSTTSVTLVFSLTNILVFLSRIFCIYFKMANYFMSLLKPSPSHHLKEFFRLLMSLRYTCAQAPSARCLEEAYFTTDCCMLRNRHDMWALLNACMRAGLPPILHRSCKFID